MSILNIRYILILSIMLFLTPISVVAEDVAQPAVAPAGSVLIDLDGMTRVGEMTTLGVQAKAYITAVASSPDGDTTHSIVVTFVNEKTGLAVEKALVGIKHRKLYGSTSTPTWMKASNDQPDLFVSDVSLKKRGTYLFIVGSKLEDNKKRQFTFQFYN